jgi:Ca-activated chloride channel family protein
VLHLLWPWCLLALPLPWCVRRWMPPSPATALHVPGWTGAPAAGLPPAPAAGRALRWAAVAWVLLVLAAARPHWAAADDQPVHRRDVMLAIDVSASMAYTDLRQGGRPLDRLAAARRIGQRLLHARRGDRVGLVVFGSQAYLYTPLTFDLQALHTALDELEVGLAGPQTALGDAVVLASRHLQERHVASRAVLVLTDGASTAGQLSPQRAAWLAERDGLRVHVIGLGAPGAAGDPARDLDEPTLSALAAQTRGRYLRLDDAAAFDAWARELDELAPRAAVEPAASAVELTVLPLLLACAVGGLLLWRAGCREAAGGRRDDHGTEDRVRPAPVEPA